MTDGKLVCKIQIGFSSSVGECRSFGIAEVIDIGRPRCYSDTQSRTPERCMFDHHSAVRLAIVAYNPPGKMNADVLLSISMFLLWSVDADIGN